MPALKLAIEHQVARIGLLSHRTPRPCQPDHQHLACRPVMSRRLRVLMSAYACEPNRGSEQEVGWQWALQMARFHDVTVLTRMNNQPAIEPAITARPCPSLKFVYYDPPPWLRFWKRRARGVQPYYYFWQMAALRVGARLHRELAFDLLHHVTFGKYWVPSYLSLLPVKSILGPLGGGESTPIALAGTFSWRGWWWERARDLARGLAKLDPALRATMRRASVVIATTDESKRRLQQLGASSVIVEPQFALDDEQLDFFSRFPRRTERPFRLISIARLLHWKGFHLGLQAFARFVRHCPESEYWVVGSGPEHANLKRIALELGIASHLKFWGYLPYAEMCHKLAEADVLVSPDMHTSFGNICLEALAAGRPVICLDTGGQSLQVTEECGFKAPVASVEQALQSMADAMTLLYRDPDRRLRMGVAAQARARKHFHWTRKAERMNVLYEEVCAGSSASAPASLGQSCNPEL